MIVYSHGHLPLELQEGVQRLCVAGAFQCLQQLSAWHYGIEAGAEALLVATGDEAALLVLECAGKLVLPCCPQRVRAPCTVVLPPGQAVPVLNIGAAPMKLVLLVAGATPSRSD